MGCYCCVKNGGPGRQFVPYGFHLYDCVFEDIGYGYLREMYTFEELNNDLVAPIQKWWRECSRKNSSQP